MSPPNGNGNGNGNGRHTLIAALIAGTLGAGGTYAGGAYLTPSKDVDRLYGEVSGMRAQIVRMQRCQSQGNLYHWPLYLHPRRVRQV